MGKSEEGGRTAKKGSVVIIIKVVTMITKNTLFCHKERCRYIIHLKTDSCRPGS